MFFVLFKHKLFHFEAIQESELHEIPGNGLQKVTTLDNRDFLFVWTLIEADGLLFYTSLFYTQCQKTSTPNIAILNNSIFSSMLVHVFVGQLLPVLL